MRRILLAAVAAVALATPASAYDLTIRYAPYYQFSPGATARIINVPEPEGEAERQAKADAIGRWTEHCHPHRHIGQYGVAYLTYDHPGCEFGEGE